MKKATLTLVALALGALMCVGPNQADARPKYKMQFDKKFMTEGSAMFKALEGKSNCNVCHVGTKDKKTRNALGMALEKALGAKNVMDDDKIATALDKAAKEKSGGADSPTFGDLLKEGKWKTTPEEK